MAQSLAKVLVHIVFSTKGRMPLIAQDVRSDLSAYMAGILRQLGSAPVLVNCVADHVHILCGLPRTLALAKTIEEVKRGSSKWFKTKATALRNFHWQNGYGAFSVSPSAAAKVRATGDLWQVRRPHPQRSPALPRCGRGFPSREPPARPRPSAGLLL